MPRVHEEGGQLRSDLRQTHTYVILEISDEAFEEIRSKLADAGYTHVFGHDSEHGLVVDMQGIAVAKKPGEKEST